MNAGYGINSSRIRLIAIRLNWAGWWWSRRVRLEILTLLPSLHRLCYSLFNRLRLVEAAIPAASLLRWNMFRALLGILEQDGTLAHRSDGISTVSRGREGGRIADDSLFAR